MTNSILAAQTRRTVLKAGGAAALLAMLGGLAQAKEKPIAVALVTSVRIWSSPKPSASSAPRATSPRIIPTPPF